MMLSHIFECWKIDANESIKKIVLSETERRPRVHCLPKYQSASWYARAKCVCISTWRVPLLFAA